MRRLSQATSIDMTLQKTGKPNIPIQQLLSTKLIFKYYVSQMIFGFKKSYSLKKKNRNKLFTISLF